MSIPILHSPHGPKPRPALAFAGGVSLARGRVHELCGPARTTLAALILGQDGKNAGPAIWISPAWQPGRIFPGGLAAFTDPGRVIFVQARHPEDVLWAMEEALRSGAVSFVLVDLQSPPGLTPVRRLHLAAEAGAGIAGAKAPIGLMLTPDTGGAQGVESRWHLEPHPAPTPQPLWRLSRLRARMEPPAAWLVHRPPYGKMVLEAAAAVV